MARDTSLRGQKSPHHKAELDENQCPWPIPMALLSALRGAAAATKLQHFTTQLPRSDEYDSSPAKRISESLNVQTGMGCLWRIYLSSRCGGGQDFGDSGALESVYELLV